ncbi:MAG: leucine-rich repeat protein [Bacteroidales bacterium]|nr:leucine-rich repeat protein [Bacteroidales bacterium]
MKKTVVYTLLLAFFILSCCEETPIIQEEPDIVSDIVSDLQFVSIADSKTISFTTNKSWEASIPNNDDWCSISQTNGDAGDVNITISVSGNNGDDDRETTLTIKTGNTIKTVKIVQAQKDEIIISEKEFEFTEKGGTFEVEISTNVALQVSIPENVDWIHYQPGETRALIEKILTFEVDECKPFDQREAIITISDNENKINDTFTVVQYGGTTIYLETAGTLSSFITEKLFNQIDSLTIKGEMNLEDFDIIDKLSALNYLDISDVVVIKYGVETYDFDKDLLEGLRYSQVFSDLILPKNIKNIKNNCFEAFSLHKIILPDNLISIGDNAFALCSHLSEINLPESLTSIGSKAFYDCQGLTSIDIPESVTIIEDYAFANCKGLTSINIPERMTIIEDYVFSFCVKLTSINIPESVTTIGKNAFEGCVGLTSINIPEDVTTIAKNAFIGCSALTSIHIPESVTIIGEYAFANCSGLTSIHIPEKVTTIQKGILSSCIGLTSIEIPESVATIGEYAFANCSGLTSIDLPESVTTIGEYAFSDCSGLTSIAIPNGITIIREGVLRSCSGLTSIYIPENVTHIEYSAFDNCINTKEVRIKAKTPPTGNGDIPNTHTIKLYIPQGSKKAYQNHQDWNNFYEYIEI